VLFFFFFRDCGFFHRAGKYEANINLNFYARKSNSKHKHVSSVFKKYCKQINCMSRRFLIGILYPENMWKIPELKVVKRAILKSSDLL